MKVLQVLQVPSTADIFNQGMSSLLHPHIPLYLYRADVTPPPQFLTRLQSKTCSRFLSLVVLPVCSSVNLIILPEQPHSLTGRAETTSLDIIAYSLVGRMLSWAVRDVAVNPPGYGRYAF